MEPEQNFCPSCGTQQKSIKDKEKQSSSQKQRSQVQRRLVPQRNYWKYVLPLIISFTGMIAGILGFVIAILRGGIHLSNLFMPMSGEPGPSGGIDFSFFSIYFFLFPLLSLLTMVGSLIYAYYLYLNFDDMQTHFHSIHGDLYPKPQDPVLMLIVLIIFSPAVFFIKYRQLHQHIKDYHSDFRNTAPSAIMVVLVILIPNFLGIFVIFAMLLLNLFFLLMVLIVAIILLTFGLFVYFEKRWQTTLNTLIAQTT